MAAKTGQILALQLHGHLTVFQPLGSSIQVPLGFRLPISAPPSNLFIPPYVHSALSAGVPLAIFPDR